MNASFSGPTCPAPLRIEVLRAAQLSCALARLVERVDPSDPSFVWLVGRADEVRAVVVSTMREWREEHLESARAAELIRGYVRTVEASRSSLFGPRATVPEESAPQFRPRSDTLIDA